MKTKESIKLHRKFHEKTPIVYNGLYELKNGKTGVGFLVGEEEELIICEVEE